MGRIPPLDGPPWLGGTVGTFAECVRAPNPSPMTLDGTNTWILHDDSHAAIVDPGPAVVSHQQAILAALERGPWQPTAVLVTHRHLDHAESAPQLAAYLRVPLHLPDTSTRSDVGSVRGSSVGGSTVHEIGVLVVDVLRTPGHTADSACLLLRDHQVLLTGDTVLGRGTSVIDPEDGSLLDYLASLERLQERAQGLTMLLPGHGPVLDDPVDVIAGYLAHRHARLDEVRAALAAGAGTVSEVRERIYGHLDPTLTSAATWSVRAQLDYLIRIGDLDADALVDDGGANGS